MALVIYGLCALAALLCTVLLFQAYGRTRSRLLLWSALAFAGLTLNNLLVILDKIILPLVDLSALRHTAALVAMVLLLCGLIWETQ